MNVFPSFIDNTFFNYLVVDNIFISTICIIDYPKSSKFLEVIESIPDNIEYDMSIYLYKQDKFKILKNISYCITNNSSEINDVSKNQVDIDVLEKVYDDAKYLRREIQINNEDIYYTYMYITIKNNDKKILFNNLKKLESALYSKNLITKTLNFRHLDGYIATLPIFNLEKSLIKSDYRNMTLSNVVNLFCFYTKNIFDKNGILFGTNLEDKRLCVVDIFNKKYTNSNMCIFGSSGSGKSYFTKLIILRNYIFNINQYIFDKEGEYIFLRKYGCVINNINIFDIFKFDLVENFLDIKINNIINFINKFVDIINKENLYKAILKVYNDYGINENINSVYKDDNIYLNKELKDNFPVISDLIKYLNKDNKEKITDVISNYYFLNEKTNDNLNGNLVIFNFKNKDLRVFEYYINIVQKLILNNNKSLIYIDEVWQYLKFNSNSIYELYKTIRKSNAGIITITQDINDFFNLDNSNFGKSILNNSYIKLFFRIEYADLDVLKKLNLKDNFDKLVRIEKGKAIMMFENNKVLLDIKSSEYEKNLIMGGIL